MSPHNRGRQMAPVYASISSAIEAEQTTAYPDPPEFDASQMAPLYREQTVLYAGEVYQHGVAAPEQLHFTSSYQYPLVSSTSPSTTLSPHLEPSTTSSAYFTPYPPTHTLDPYGNSIQYAASDASASALDDIFEDPESGLQTASSSSASGAANATDGEKRRRNQAASARFRQKKKAREAQMERSLKELSERRMELEERVRKLEVENRFLKDLLTEKEGNKRERDVVSIPAGRGKGRARRVSGSWGVGVVFEDDEMRDLDDRKDGVGTS